ncbi:MAG: hypothetical protein J6W59_06300 [Bacteroidales bacterium]|nr:hypothetical protein [Bacteroidales bacterium]
MFKKVITYTDYNGEERTEDFYFNLSRAEVTEMELSTEGGLGATIERITKAKDVPAIIAIFKDLILKAYGQKSPDGKRFIKSKQLSEEFSQTEAYSNLFMELATDSTAASEFINNIMPIDQKSVAKASLEIVQ